MAFPTSTKYVIVGAGIHGLSTAYHLALTSPHLSVAVVERDPHGTFASMRRALTAGWPTLLG